MIVRPGNAQHQGAREAQQDSFAFSDPDAHGFTAHAGLLGIVADGMGGMAHGGAAGAAAVRALLDAYGAKSPGESIAAALQRAMHAANEAVVALARAIGEPDDVGTTAAVIVVHEATLQWASVGDSRVYLWRGGRLVQVTADHVYAADLDAKVAAGRMTLEEAAEDPDRESLTSHLGSAHLRAIDRSVRPLPLFEGDRVLVCSDGLYRALTPEELSAPLAGNPQRACETLVERALAKRHDRQDNLTVIVIGLDADGVTTDTTGTMGTTRRTSMLTPMRVG
jgi:serine/threonine protein phosphatase PrpC